MARVITRNAAYGKIIKAASQKGWDYDELHSYMNDWGFGTSLKALNEKQLSELLQVIGAGKWFVKHDGKSQQEGMIYRLAGRAGFSKERLRKLIKSMYDTTELSKLDQNQRRGLIATLKNYERKQKKGNL